MSPINRNESKDAIAIVGLSCRFPGEASSPSSFWELLKSGRDGFSTTTDRYNAEAFVHTVGGGGRQNVVPTKGGYFLKQSPYVFDAAFFNITAAEAIALDPRQRIAMEVAYEALENAGFSLQRTAGTQTACFMGSSMSDYRDRVARDFQQFPKYHILGVSDEMIANRVSHFLDIHGPSATVQTACSSSLVATHLACQSLHSGESEMALAGGVGLIISTDGTMHLNNVGFLNPAGHSKSFDAEAGGYARGEGCGVLVLKRLKDAVRDGDTVRAVIRASGVNSDGWTPGVTMPSQDAQAALIKYVYESSNLDYGATQYVEAHGTGTQAGDPVETGAIHRTIGNPQKSSRKKLYIGSVKPNIGHLEAAAGVASIIKGVLALEHGQIPPNIRFSKPNPKIPLEEWNMKVPTEVTPWPTAKTKRMSISGFGMGGTNAHVVLEAPGSSPKSITTSKVDKKRLFTFSAHDKAGFGRIGETLTEYLDTVGLAASSPAYLADLAHTLAIARSGLVWRAVCLAENVADLREELHTKVGEAAVRAPSNPPRIGFVFTGQGAQWARMGIEMLARPVFKRSVTESARLLKEMGADWDPIVELSKSQKESRLGTPEISQPICTVLQVGLVDELQSWGVTPSKVVGHSSGEIAAAYAIGALSHRDAVAVAYLRGVASAGVRDQLYNGGMMAVGCSRDKAEDLMEETQVRATVACVNSPSSITISGDADTLEKLRAILEERGIFARRLKVDVAYHSSHMHSCSAGYYASMANLGLGEYECQEEESTQQPPAVMVSSVTASEIDPEQIVPYYWVQNLISPVLFADALKELAAPADAHGEKAIDLLLEVGPHSALGGPLKEILADAGIQKVGYGSMLTRGQNAIDTSLNLAGELFRLGVPIDVEKVNADSDCHLLTGLPPYPWNHAEEFRADSRLTREWTAQQFPTKSLIGTLLPRMDENEHVWRGFIRLSEEPWLRGHTVGSTVLFPAAGMISMVIEAAQQIRDLNLTALSFKFRDISFLAAMALSEEIATEVTVVIRPHLLATSGSVQASWWEFTLSSCVGPTGQLRDNCRGLLSIAYEENRSPDMAREDIEYESMQISDHQRVASECQEICPHELFYDHMIKCSLHYSEVFQGVRNSRPGFGKSCYEVEIVDIGETFAKGKLERPFLIHAATLDAIFQGWLGSTRSDSNDNGDFGFDKPMLPMAIGELEISANIPGDVGYTMPASCYSHRHNFNEFSANLTVLNRDTSKVLLSIADFRSSQLEIGDEESSNDDGGSAKVDPAEISSEVHWNYALDFMGSADVRQVLSGEDISGSNQKLYMLLEMAIHQQPALNVIELVQGDERYPDTVLSLLPQGVIRPSQAHFAVIDWDSDHESVSGTHGEGFGKPFALGASDAPLPTDIAAADFLLIPQQVCSHLKEDLVKTLDRLVLMAKPGAVVAIAAVASDVDKIASSTLKAKGFEAVLDMAANTEHLVMYRDTSTNKGVQQEAVTNGTHPEDVVVLLPTILSPKSLAMSEGLQRALEDQKHSVVVKKGLADLHALSGKTCISLLELEKPMLEDLSESEFHSLQELALNCGRLLWITCGNNPSFGMVDGFLRCLNNEAGDHKFQVLHLSSGGMRHGPSLATRILESKLSSSTADNEFRERAGLLQVQRIYNSPAENTHIRNHLEDSIKIASLDDNTAHFRLTIGRPGLLDSLHYVRDERFLTTPLDDNKLELQVKASGINFRDVMASMGLVPITEVGYEASGIVLRTGKQAANSFKPGDRVCTVSLGGTHATVARCDSRVTAKLPDKMSFEEGAAVPTVHATAYYALVKLAKLHQGQSVLIHAAAGGVGQAAIQLAKHLGLVIYVTVGSEDKRQFVMQQYGIPKGHIFNSRDASFAKGIRRVTKRRGVDCVLNSLSGELLRVSWGCLATFGTFVEIGMRDIKDNMRLDMRPFGKTATFTYFEIPTLIQKDPSALGEVLNEVLQLVQKGILRIPRPLTVYQAGEAEDAFRIMQQGKHRGKMLLSFSEDDKTTAPLLCKAKDSLQLDPNATYLFVGGLGGLGRSLAKEFVSSGARHLAFISRSGDSKPEARAVVDELTASGAQVKVLRADIADRSSFLAAMEQCSQQLPPVKGVLHMAMVLRDVVFEKMTYEDWSISVRPKVQGTWNLHEYFSHERPLDFMVLCSSLSGICGNAAQAQYDAGNAYQDNLANYRSSQGLKAISINLGIMLDVGILSEMGDHKLKLFEDVLGIREPAFHALMKSAINSQLGKRGGDNSNNNSNNSNNLPSPSHLAVGLGDADILASHNLPSPPWFPDSRFGALANASSSSANSSNSSASAAASLESQLIKVGKEKDTTAAAEIVTGALVNKTAEILRIPRTEVDPSRPLYTYGVDSLVALEVRNWITRQIRANVALFDIMAAVPMENFARQIAEKSKFVVG